MEFGELRRRCALVQSPALKRLAFVACKWYTIHMKMKSEIGKAYMAVDQDGNTHHALKHPCRDLLARLNARTADRMFVKRGGRTYHIGYVIGDRWLTLYEVMPFRKDVQVPESVS